MKNHTNSISLDVVIGAKKGKDRVLGESLIYIGWSNMPFKEVTINWDLKDSCHASFSFGYKVIGKKLYVSLKFSRSKSIYSAGVVR